jgi:predicted alpha/beta-fold hydrolase
VPWSTSTHDPEQPIVRLSGALCERADSDSMLVIVHGLGGATESHYCVRAAHAAHAAGVSSLRLALRGADRSGEDFYHAGLASDVEAALASPELARYAHLYVLGYSLGGHVSVHVAQRWRDTRLRAVAAVCAPLDLDQSARAIDDPRLLVYRHHVLSGLKDIYAHVAARKPVPTPLPRVRAIRTIREWDTLTVVPRYGFSSVDDYYARMSAARVLAQIHCPTLLLPSRQDPMVPPWALEHCLPSRSASVSLEWIEHGGHVGYPPHVDVDKRALNFLLAHRG